MPEQLTTIPGPAERRLIDRMAPVMKITGGTSAATAATDMRDAIAARVQEMIADRERASLRATTARDSKAIGAQIASLNVVLAFVASIKVEF